MQYEWFMYSFCNKNTVISSSPPPSPLKQFSILRIETTITHCLKYKCSDYVLVYIKMEKFGDFADRRLKSFKFIWLSFSSL